MAAKRYVITSGKGGVGKSSATINIGAALAALDKRVLIIDADIGLRNLDLLLGLESDGVFHLLDVLNGTCACKEAVVSDKRFSCLHLLFAPQTAEKSAVSESQMKSLCEKEKEHYDYILIDAPAGTEQGFSNAIAGVSRAIVVTTPDLLSVRNTDKIIGKLEERGIEAQLIVNRIRPDLIKRGEQQGAEFVMDALGIALVGLVPEDDAVISAQHRGEPVIMDANSRAGQAYRNIAKRLEGENIPLLELDKKSGLFNRKKS